MLLPLPRTEVPACASVLFTAVSGLRLLRPPRKLVSFECGPEGGALLVGEGPDGAPIGALPPSLGPAGGGACCGGRGAG